MQTNPSQIKKKEFKSDAIYTIQNLVLLVYTDSQLFKKKILGGTATLKSLTA